MDKGVCKDGMDPKVPLEKFETVLSDTSILSRVKRIFTILVHRWSSSGTTHTI